MGYANYLIVVAIALMAGDILTGGYVMEKVNETFGGEGGAKLAGDAACLFGIQTLPPFKEFFGITVFWPSWDDVAEAIVLSLVIIFFLHLFFKGIDINLWSYIIILVAAWLFIKLLALYFVLSVPGCSEMLINNYKYLRPLEAVGIVLAPLILFKFLWSKFAK